MTLCTGVVPPLVAILAVVLPFIVSSLLSPSFPPLPLTTTSPPPSSSSTSSPFLGSSCAGLTVVMQASDIHLSTVHHDRLTRFESLVRDVVPVVRPSLVLLTGDITDANRGVMESLRGQQRDEWDMYRSALRGGGEMLSILPWLDVRGNHDAFNVPVSSSSANLFNAFRRSTTFSPDVTPEGHYVHVLRRPFGTYKFVAVEAVVERAPDRHFFGELRSGAAAALDAVLDTDPSDPSPPDMTLVFGHYPSNTIGTIHTPHSSGGGGGGGGGGDDDQDAAVTQSLVELMDDHGVVAYLSGHLHRLFGITLYGRHPTGGLELELGDFKFNSMFRVLAIDGGLLSFTDVSLGQWPVVLVTNPKDARFLSKHEPVGNIATSTAVRVLAYARPGDAIASVTVSVDGSAPQAAQRASVDELVEDSPWKELGHPANAPLWTAPWPVAPSELGPGLHDVRVEVRTEKGDVRVQAHKFSVDGTLDSFHWFEQAFMTRDFQSLLWMAVGIALTITAGGMLLRPYLFAARLKESGGGGDSDSAVADWLTATFKTAANGGDGAGVWHYLIDQSLAPYVAFYHYRPGLFKAVSWFIVYLLVGPWFVGHVFNDQLGLQFGWGIWVPGHLLPHYDACIFLNLILITGVAPLIHVLGLTSARQHCVGAGVKHPGAASIAGVLMACLVTFEVTTAVIPGSIFHGVYAMLLSPAYTYFGLSAFFLAWSSVTMDVIERCTGRRQRQTQKATDEKKE